VEHLLRVEEVLPGLEPGVRWYGTCVVKIVTWDPAGLTRKLRGGLGPFVGPVPRAEPGLYRELDARVVLPGQEGGSVRNAVDGFLRSIRCAVVTARDGEAYTFTASAQARKRKSFLSGRVRRGGAAVELWLTVGPRFPLRELVDALERASAQARSPEEAGELVVEMVDIRP
jgi:hypothetical protein